MKRPKLKSVKLEKLGAITPTRRLGITGRILQNPVPVIVGTILLFLVVASKVYWKRRR